MSFGNIIRSAFYHLYNVANICYTYKQLITWRGTLDIDDIILNSLGILIGFWSVQIADEDRFKAKEQVRRDSLSL